MATHSSILAWRIGWTEEPGRLQSMGSQRVGHNQASYTHTHFLWASQITVLPLVPLGGTVHGAKLPRALSHYQVLHFLPQSHKDIYMKLVDQKCDLSSGSDLSILHNKAVFPTTPSPNHHPAQHRGEELNYHSLFSLAKIKASIFGS